MRLGCIHAGRFLLLSNKISMLTGEGLSKAPPPCAMKRKQWSAFILSQRMRKILRMCPQSIQQCEQHNCENSCCESPQPLMITHLKKTISKNRTIRCRCSIVYVLSRICGVTFQRLYCERIEVLQYHSPTSSALPAVVFSLHAVIAKECVPNKFTDADTSAFTLNDSTRFTQNLYKRCGQQRNNAVHQRRHVLDGEEFLHPALTSVIPFLAVWSLTPRQLPQKFSYRRDRASCQHQDQSLPWCRVVRLAIRFRIQ